MTDTAVPTTDELVARFPEAVTLETRKSYPGYVTKPENLLEVATALRDEMGYDFLSSVTATDYITENNMELVYHFRKTTGGGVLVLHVPTDRENSVVPSLVAVYPGAELQEREVLSDRKPVASFAFEGTFSE